MGLSACFVAGAYHCASSGGGDRLFTNKLHDSSVKLKLGEMHRACYSCAHCTPHVGRFCCVAKKCVITAKMKGISLSLSLSLSLSRMLVCVCVCVCVCVSVCVCVCLCLCVRARERACMRAWVSACVRAYVCVSVSVFVCVCVCVCERERERERFCYLLVA